MARWSRATAYRYATRPPPFWLPKLPDPHQALARVADAGWSHVILDGKIFGTDRSLNLGG